MEMVNALATPVLSAIALALLGTLGTLAYRLGLTYLEAHRIDTRWYEAIGRAGGVVYTSLAASGRPITDKEALARAAMAGAAYLTQRVGDIATLKALTPVDLAQIAAAEAGKLLATDPGVSVGGGGTATATAAPGQTATATTSGPGA